MRKVNKLVLKKTVGFEFTTNEFVRFESNSEKGLIYIEDMGGQMILLDITEETTLMLKELFRYVHEDFKADDDA